MRIWVLFLTLAIGSIASDNAFAHIEHGGMPDSVAEMEYRILLEFEPNKHDIRNKLGDVLYRLKKYEEAKSEFLAVLAKDSDNFQAHVGLAQLLMHDQKWKEAENKFLELQKTHSDNVELSYYLGIIYSKTGRLKFAEKMLTEALKKAQTEKSEESAHIVGKINEALVDIKNQGIIPQTEISQ